MVVLSTTPRLTSVGVLRSMVGMERGMWLALQKVSMAVMVGGVPVDSRWRMTVRCLKRLRVRSAPSFWLATSMARSMKKRVFWFMVQS